MTSRLATGLNVQESQVFERAHFLALDLKESATIARFPFLRTGVSTVYLLVWCLAVTNLKEEGRYLKTEHTWAGFLFRNLTWSSEHVMLLTSWRHWWQHDVIDQTVRPDCFMSATRLLTNWEMWLCLVILWVTVNEWVWVTNARKFSLI